MSNLSLFPHDELVKLRDAERLIAACFKAESRPSRSTIIAWIEDGTIAGKKIGTGRNYYVFESSLQNFIADLSSDPYAVAA